MVSDPVTGQPESKDNKTYDGVCGLMASTAKRVCLYYGGALLASSLLSSWVNRAQMEAYAEMLRPGSLNGWAFVNSVVAPSDLYGSSVLNPGFGFGKYHLFIEYTRLFCERTERYAKFNPKANPKINPKKRPQKPVPIRPVHRTLGHLYV